MMKLRNYTTSVPADRTLQQIEKLLADFGASHIMKEYMDGKVIWIAFKINNSSYKLPANIEGVFRAIYSTDRTQSKMEQAYRCAWRIIKDWIHAQLSIIASGQAMPDEVLLPYLWDGKRTLYEVYKSGELQLPAPDKQHNLPYDENR